MALQDDLRQEFHNFSTIYGRAITIVDGFTRSYSGAQHDQAYLSSGTTVSGQVVFMPMGPSDESFVAQGIINPNDKKLFIHGSYALTTDAVLVIGSRYSILPEGIRPWEVSGTVVYQRVFVRMWNGSPIQYI